MLKRPATMSFAADRAGGASESEINEMKRSIDLLRKDMDSLKDELLRMIKALEAELTKKASIKDLEHLKGNISKLIFKMSLMKD
jgi:hypothetical protein